MKVIFPLAVLLLKMHPIAGHKGRRNSSGQAVPR